MDLFAGVLFPVLYVDDRPGITIKQQEAVSAGSDPTSTAATAAYATRPLASGNSGSNCLEQNPKRKHVDTLLASSASQKSLVSSLRPILPASRHASSCNLIKEPTGNDPTGNDPTAFQTAVPSLGRPTVLFRSSVTIERPARVAEDHVGQVFPPRFWETADMAIAVPG